MRADGLQEIEPEDVDLAVFVPAGNYSEERFAEELFFLGQVGAFEPDDPYMWLQSDKFERGQIAERNRLSHGFQHILSGGGEFFFIETFLVFRSQAADECTGIIFEKSDEQLPAQLQFRRAALLRNLFCGEF